MGPPKGRRVKNYVKSKMRGDSGEGGENAKMNEQLALLGLKVVSVTGDGNCFFRAIADQLEGNEEEHVKYRGKAVDYLEEHKEDFEPFLEDEITFDHYCNNMRQDGTWAGHMELQATSLVTKCDICIHRVQFPRWQILNFQSPGTPILQLSYHGEEHYNSVRKKEDDGVGPPELETIKGQEDPANDRPPAKDGTGMKKDFSEVKLVMARSGCADPIHVNQVLKEVHGDKDAAIEFLKAEAEGSDDSASSSDLISFDDSRTSNEEQADCLSRATEGEQDPSLVDTDDVTDGPSNGSDIRSTVSRAKNAIMHPGKTVARNKRCPCGSKKKYKKCCGAVHGRAGVVVLPRGHEGGSLNKVHRTSPQGDSMSSLGASSTMSTDSNLGVVAI